MKNIFKFYFNNDYTKWEWICIKISLLAIWLKTIFPLFNFYKEVAMPLGICKILPCEYLNSSWIAIFILITIIVFSVLYLLEKRMMLSTFIIFFLSLLFFTLEESNGVFERRGLLTFMFFAQFIAYALHSFLKRDFNLTTYRVQFSIQVIAIGYFLSGCSKLMTSGLQWITDGIRMPLQILKSFHSSYANNGEEFFLEQGAQMVQFIESNHLLVYFVLAGTLLLELGAISVLFFSKKYTVVYGILLFCMHMGIFIVMDIKIVTIFHPMIALFLNPLYLGLIITYVLYQKYF